MESIFIMTWSLANIEQLSVSGTNALGVSSHLEINQGDSNDKYQLYYTGDGGVTVNSMSTDLELTKQGEIKLIQDLTIITTNEGIRRAYYVEVDPNTGNHEILTALLSEDGLTLSQATRTGILDNGDNAWGVPDSVVLPDGRIRIYWVSTDNTDSEWTVPQDDEIIKNDGFKTPNGEWVSANEYFENDRKIPDSATKTLANEVILSATSDTSKGTEFTVDEGYRTEGGYVDFEVLKAKENDWLAIMSSSPVTIPDEPQGIYIGISSDGLSWEIDDNNLAPLERSYLDPTGLLLSNTPNKYQIVMSSSLSILGDREYTLVTAELTSATTTYLGNSFDYNFFNIGNGVYGIRPDSTGTIDSLTGISNIQFDDKKLNITSDIKATFDQVTGLNTDSGEMFRLYNAAFARFPDADGLKYWIEQFSSGKNTRRVVAQSFLGSAEFTEKYGSNVSDETYVNNLYKNVLGRDADAEGLNYWVGNLSNGIETRYEALLGFSESEENKALFTEMTGFG
ncbi:DUF4214 domain-containing protein [Prochlorococcus marinus]|nr:DUF4214 domain-containing protein [Prochlorococcus marinus]